jgi:Fe-S-cluster containining protein
MRNGEYEKLKTEWFAPLGRILKREYTTPSSSLKCLELCQAHCCPHIAMRSMQAGQIASAVVVLLPFEMEYLMEKTGAPRSVFRTWPIDITPDLPLDVGILDLGKPCPFLRGDLRCGIHEHNPLDCRTYPLLPYQNYRGELQWALGENCPSLHLLNENFTSHIKSLWQQIYPSLPQSWWDLYAFADHWTGWPLEQLQVEEYAAQG